MKTTTLLTIIFLFVLGCKKNDEPKIEQVNTKKAAEELMKTVNQELASLDEGKYLEKAELAKAALQDFRNSSLKSTQTSDILLSELFYIYEGIVNYDNANLDQFIQDPQTVETTLTCNINFDASQGAYYLTMQELSSFLLEIDQMLDNNVNENTESINMIDLNLESIANNTASIRVRLTKGVLPAGSGLFMTPSDPVWAANQQGACTTSNGGYDGADFLRAYANTQAPHNQLVCPTGTQKYIVVTSSYNTTQISDFIYPAAQYYGVGFPSGTQLTQYYSQYIMPKSWYGQNNLCIGYNNSEWYSRYASLDFLITTNLTTAVYQNSSAEFINTNYKSHSGNTSPFPPNINYYHSGIFYYGVVYCN